MPRITLLSFLALIFLLLVLQPALALEYRGKVVGVHDGDTITVLTPAKKQIKARLAEIDTPESKQPYGTRAKQALSDKVFGKTVTVEQETVDRYGRVVGHVHVGSRHVNREMVREGYAWVYRDYMRDRSLLDDERSAREAKRGLWSLPEVQRTPPWEWRRAQRSGSGSSGRSSTSTSAQAKAPSSYSASCGSKRTCGQMSSCAEAKFYLAQCGLSRLDRDRDGVPCESLCR